MTTEAPAPADRHRLIDRLRVLPAELAGAVRGLDADRLRTPYRDGGWTVAQVVHHLADAHAHGWVRMRLMVAEDHPTLRPYDQDVWASTPDAQSVRLAASLAMVRGIHARWVRFLAGLTSGAWDRTGYHPEHGTVTLGGLVRHYAEHGETHVAQITGLRARRGW